MYQGLTPGGKKAVAGATGAIVLLVIGAGVAIGVASDDEENPRETSATDKPSAKETKEPKAEESPSAEPTVSPTPEPPTSPEPEPQPAPDNSVLTIETNPELAALLSSPENSDLSAAFSDKYQGRTMEFNGNVANVIGGGASSTVLVYAGNFSETSASGPSFQFKNNGPTNVSTGGNYRFTVEVGEFDDLTGLFQLRPITAVPR